MKEGRKEALGKGGCLILRVTALQNSNVWFSTKITNHKTYKDTGKSGPFKGKYKLTETLSKKEHMVEFLEKTLKQLS